MDNDTLKQHAEWLGIPEDEYKAMITKVAKDLEDFSATETGEITWTMADFWRAVSGLEPSEQANTVKEIYQRISIHDAIIEALN